MAAGGSAYASTVKRTILSIYLLLYNRWYTQLVILTKQILQLFSQIWAENINEDWIDQRHDETATILQDAFDVEDVLRVDPAIRGDWSGTSEVVDNPEPVDNIEKQTVANDLGHKEVEQWDEAEDISLLDCLIDCPTQHLGYDLTPSFNIKGPL